mmetsp:Transcript_17072/g.45598  ORF Transcript_17072/g.45598 Transcript_17072/m.45598 type:complete len:203 (-) Transcript_17072:1496-2104(-)
MGPLDIVVDPLLAIVGALLVEGQVDRLAILVALPAEAQLVVLDVLEVFLCLLRSAGAQTLVVLDLPSLASVVLLLPSLIFVLCEESDHLAALGGLDDRGHKLLHKATLLEQVRPPKVEEIEEQALDVGTIVVLIRHDHDRAIAHLVVVTLLPERQAEDLDNVHDLLVLRDLLLGHIADVKQLAAQWEDAILIPTNDPQACNC